MNKLDSIIEEKPNGFQNEVKKKDLSLEEIIDFLVGENFDKKSTFTAGRVFQKIKK